VLLSLEWYELCNESNGYKIWGADGCTQIKYWTWQLHLKPADIITDKTICSGASFLWNGIELYNESNGYKIQSWWLYCRSSIELDSYLKPADNLQTKQFVLSETTFLWNGTAYTTDQTGLRFPGKWCTADQVLNLTVTNHQISLQTKQFVLNFFPLNGTSYTTNLWVQDSQELMVVLQIKYWTWQ
jgi:hypothetical protein